MRVWLSFLGFDCWKDSNYSFYRLLTMDVSDMGARSSSESSMVSSTFGESTTADFNEDTEYLIRIDQSKPPLRFEASFLSCILYMFFEWSNFLPECGNNWNAGPVIKRFLQWNQNVMYLENCIIQFSKIFELFRWVAILREFLFFSLSILHFFFY